MNRSEFIEAIITEVKNQSNNSIQVTYKMLEKNNGTDWETLEFSMEGNPYTPVYFVDPYYEEYQDGQSIRSIVRTMIYHFNLMMEQECIAPDFFESYDKLSDRIYCRLIDFKKNKKMMKEVPHARWMDLAVVFYYKLDDEMFENATILVRKDHLKHWGVGTKKVQEDAWKNTIRDMTPEFKPLNQVIREMHEAYPALKDECDEITQKAIQESMQADIDDTEGLYVLTTIQKGYGAISICYPEMAQHIAKTLGRNFFVLPASIHEIMILPDYHEYDVEELSILVKDINESVVDPEDVLSNVVHYYSIEEERYLF